MVTATKKKYHQGVGRRKTSIAQVRLFPGGKGIITINGKPIDEYMPEKSRQDVVTAPLQKVGGSFDVTIVVTGGGKVGQTEAIRHGISRSLVAMDAQVKPALKAEGFLKRDDRKKERKKPGLKKARRAKQWRKR